MKKLVPLLILLFTGYLPASAAGGEYAVANISPALLKDANAVKRNETLRYEVVSLTNARLSHRYAITILNENGDRFAEFVEYYDKLRSVKSIDGKLFDAGGRELKSLKNKDIEDRSDVGSDLMVDGRYKIHNFFYRTYPYTVEYEVVTEYNNTFSFPAWQPQRAEKLSVESSSMIVTTPASFSFQYKMFNYPGNPGITEEKDKKIYHWQIISKPAIQREYADPDWSYFSTEVYFKPDKFEVAGYKGTTTSWKELGEFQLQLNKGRDVLPEGIRERVHQLTDKISDVKEKIRVLYEYLQNNTRYISIQLGIGGWQPFDAMFVAKNSYGDCKALSNYMYSLLKEAKIRSCYTQIRAGNRDHFFMPDFSMRQFNHIILCVPLDKDSVWLECTSQTLPAGYLSGFTSDRFALLVDEDGGHLVKTPKYGVKENTEIRHIKAVLDSEGTLQVKSETTYGGLQQDSYHDLIHSLSKEKVKEYLHELLDFATYDINSFNYKENKSSLPTIEESLDIIATNYATITGKRLFIIPNIMTRANRKLTADTERKHDIDLSFEFNDIDSVQIELPDGYSAEAIPQDVSINGKFGRYKCSVRLEGKKLIYYRSYEHFSGRFPAKDYAELVNFYQAIYKADRNKVVLVKNIQ